MKKNTKKSIKLEDLKETFEKEDKIDKALKSTKSGNERMGNGGNCSCNHCSA